MRLVADWPRILATNPNTHRVQGLYRVQRADHDSDQACCPAFVEGLRYAAAVYTIRHASVLTGVPVATLRAWERRYGVVHPARTDAGYRLYDERALQVLSAMAELVSAGWSPRQAAEQVAAADVEDTTEGLLRFTRSSVDQLELQALSHSAILSLGPSMAIAEERARGSAR